MTSDEEASTDPYTAKQWVEFAKKCPKTDLVQDYVNEDPARLHIPFRDILFSSTTVDFSTHVSAKRSARDYLSGKEKTGASVIWGNRGKKLGKRSYSNIIY